MLSIENQKNTICIGFQFHNPKLSQEGCFKTYIYYARCFKLYACYIKLLQGALRNKQLIASFVEDFDENHENLIRDCLQFYIPKLSQERCFILYLICETMYRAQDTREATNYFFRKTFLKESHWNIKRVIFQSHVTKFDHKRYSALPYCYSCLCARCSTKKAIKSLFHRSL